MNIYRDASSTHEQYNIMITSHASWGVPKAILISQFSCYLRVEYSTIV